MNSQRSLAVLAIVGAVVGGAIGPSAVFAETATRPCNPMDEQNVYDIRIARTTSSLMVDVKQAERLHFEHLEADFRSGEATRNPRTMWSELEYMVRRYPNHIGALSMLDRLSALLKTDEFRGAMNSVDCHFQRAIAFVPDDADVRTVYGIYLLKRNRLDDGIAQLHEAERMRPNSGNVQYNLGLAYVSKKDLDRAREHAIRAYRMGFGLPGLKEKLRSAGRWGAEEESAIRPPAGGQVQQDPVGAKGG